MLARLDHKRSRHFDRIFAMYTKVRGSSDYPFELWLGRVSFRLESPGYARLDAFFLADFSASLANSAFNGIKKVKKITTILTESGIYIKALISISRRDDTLPIDLSSPCCYWPFFFSHFLRRMRLPFFIHLPFESVEK